MRVLYPSVILSAVILSLALASCIDGRYRIDDVDTGMTIAPGGIDIPLSSIPKKTLGEMLSGVDYLVADPESGYYTLSYSNTYAYSVPGINFDQTPNLSRVIDKIFVRSSDIDGGGGTQEIGGGTDISSQFRVTEIVKTIKNIILKSAANVGANATMRLVLGIENPLLDKLYIDDFTMQLPRFLVIADDPRVDADNVYRDPRIVLESGGSGSFRHTVVELQVTGLRDVPVDEQNMATLLGRFDFSGTVRTPEGSAVDPDAPQMGITPEIDFSDIRLTALEGELGFKLDDYISESIRPIELKSVFDALGLGGRRKPDLAAPVVMLSITNPLGVALTGSMIFDPKDSEGQSLGRILAEDLRISGSPGGEPYENLMYITDEASSGAPQGYVPYNVNTSLLVETLPYTIDLEIEASAVPDINHLIDLGADDYPFGLTLNVDIPLAFGSEMDLAIERSVAVGEIFSKLADLDVRASEVGVTAELEVSFPLMFENITVWFADVEGNPVPGLEVRVAGIIEGPSPEKGGAKTSRLEIALSVPDGGDFQALRTVEKLGFSIPVSGTGTLNRLNRDDYVAGKLWLTLPGGISADFEKI